jgi:hypothetical protein
MDSQFQYLQPGYEQYGLSIDTEPMASPYEPLVKSLVRPSTTSFLRIFRAPLELPFRYETANPPCGTRRDGRWHVGDSMAIGSCKICLWAQRCGIKKEGRHDGENEGGKNCDGTEEVRKGDVSIIYYIVN